MQSARRALRARRSCWFARKPTAICRAIIPPPLPRSQRQLERVAREGREKGSCLGLVSQRPSELSATALSQCGTILALRLNNQEDQRELKASMSEGARNLIELSHRSKTASALSAGRAVPVPMRLLVDTVEAAT